MINKKSVIGLGLVGLISVMSFSSAFAGKQNKNLQYKSNKVSSVAKYERTGTRCKRTNPLESLVTAGTITSDQLTAIQTAMKSARASGKTMKEVLDGLVTAGTITQTQEDAVINAMPFKGQGAREWKNNPLKSLVTAGTITSDQLTAIQTAMRSSRDTGKTMKEVLDSLVTAGTITQIQEDAVISAFPKRDENRTSPLASLVTAGTITSDQLTAIQTAMRSARDSGKTMKEVLDSLVTAGTITQAQEDAVISAMQANKGWHKNESFGKHDNDRTDND